MPRKPTLADQAQIDIDLERELNPPPSPLSRLSSFGERAKSTTIAVAHAVGDEVSARHDVKSTQRAAKRRLVQAQKTSRRVARDFGQKLVDATEE